MKVPTLMPPFLACDINANKGHCIGELTSTRNAVTTKSHTEAKMCNTDAAVDKRHVLG